MSSNRHVYRILPFYAISGFVSLGYQVSWFRIITDWFGSTNLSFALVVCSFIGGLGVGSLLSSRISAVIRNRFGIIDRLRVYGIVELLVSAAALLTVLVEFVPPDLWGTFPYVLHDGIWVQETVYRAYQVAVGVLCVFLPCLFMGVTFPLICHAYLGVAGGGRFPAALYAWNTLGACSGVLATQFLLILWIGHKPSFWLMVAINSLLGLYFLRFGGAPDRDARGGTEPSPELPEPSAEPNRVHYGAMLFLATLSGLLAGALEGDMFRRISFMLGSVPGATMSFISFWAILAIFLASALVNRLSRINLVAIKVAFLVAAVSYYLAWQLRISIMAVIHGDKLLLDLQGLSGEVSFPATLTDLFLFTGVFVFIPYFLVSLLFPFVCNRLQASRRHLGLAYGMNTVAFCAGLIGFSLIAPMVNIFYSTKLLFALLVLGGVFFLVISERSRNAGLIAAAFIVGIGAVGVLTPAGLDRDYFWPGSRPAINPIRALKSNGAHTTFVVDAGDPKGNAYLYFEQHSMSGTNLSSQSYMRLMAHVPLLAQKDPRNALLICFGVGNTASAIARHSTIERIDAVDLNDQVFATAPEFSRFNDDVYLDPRIRLIHDDGRGFLRMTGERYDLITSEPPPPMAAGVYRLYSREYYEAALAHLTEDGMMSQWLPIYQLPATATDLIISTFLEVFPHVSLVSGWTDNTGRHELILIGGRQPLDLRRIHKRFAADSAVIEDLQRIDIYRPTDLVLRWIADEKVLAPVYRGMGTISDQHNDLEHMLTIVDLNAELRIDGLL